MADAAMALSGTDWQLFSEAPCPNLFLSNGLRMDFRQRRYTLARGSRFGHRTRGHHCFGPFSLLDGHGYPHKLPELPILYTISGFCESTGDPVYTKKGRILLVGLDLNYFPKIFFRNHDRHREQWDGLRDSRRECSAPSGQAGSGRLRFFSSAGGHADELSMLSPERPRGNN